jgi:trigger factor
MCRKACGFKSHRPHSQGREKLAQTQFLPWSDKLNLEKSILEGHEAQVVVEVEAERLQAARQHAARKLATRGKIPGFRPGKAPYDVIVRYYGEAAVNEQALDLLVDEVYPEMLKEAGLEAAAAGSLEKVEGEETPRFTFKVPLSPEVKLGEYHALRVPYEFQAPGPDKLDDSLNELRQVYATTQTVERPAELGDYLAVEIQSELQELARPDMPVMIRDESQTNEFPFLGFARLLIGMNAGEAKSVHHDYPADAPIETLAGKSVDLNVTVKTVRSVTLPALDDEFAKLVGKYENLAGLKEALAKEIEARARAEYEDQYFTNIVDALRKEAEIKFAAQTLEHEAEHVVEDMRRRLAQQGLDLETYYKMRSTDAAKFLEDEAKPVALKRLERSLILDEVARVEKIEVDNAALDEEFSTTLMDLQGQGLNLNSVRGGRQGQQRLAEAVAMQSASRLLTRRTLERLKAIAMGEFKPGEETTEPQGGQEAEKSAVKKSAPARKSKTGARKVTRKK